MPSRRKYISVAFFLILVSVVSFEIVRYRNYHSIEWYKAFVAKHGSELIELGSHSGNENQSVLSFNHPLFNAYLEQHIWLSEDPHRIAFHVKPPFFAFPPETVELVYYTEDFEILQNVMTSNIHSIQELTGLGIDGQGYVLIQRIDQNWLLERSYIPT